MTSKEMKEIGIYAAATMVLTIGLFSARAAVSRDEQLPTLPKVVVQGMDAYTAVQPGRQPDTVTVTLRIANPVAEARRIDLNLNLVRVDFTGNPMSRVVMPSDRKSTIERSRRVRGKIRGHATADYRWTWKIDAARPEPGKLSNVPSYLINWQGEAPVDGKASTVTLAGFPASTGWAKTSAGK